MLKGVNKRVIVIKNPESEIFEEAYFICKNKNIFTQPKENEMVLEANRIIADYSKKQKLSLGLGLNNNINNINKNDNNTNNINNKTSNEKILKEKIAEEKFFALNNFGAAKNNNINKNLSNNLNNGINNNINARSNFNSNANNANNSVGSTGNFKLVSSKKIRKFKIKFPEFKLKLKAPPKSFFIGVGFMSALIIAARLFEFILAK